MKNLLKPILNYYDEHNNHYKKRLDSENVNNTLWELTSTQETSLKQAYIEYEELYNKNELNKLNRYNFFNIQEKENYLFLFDSSLSFFRNLKKNAKYINGQAIGDCPFCEHGKPTTLDHIVPKEVRNGFPEFCDNPLNLIPMCQACNGKKGTIFKNETGQLELINLYRDELPNDIQYLYVKASLTSNGIIKIEFYFDGSQIKDADFARRLGNTYDYLDLLNYYNDLSTDKIDVLKNQIFQAKSLNVFTKETLKDFIIKQNYILNYWEHVLTRELVSSTQIYEILYSS